MRLYGKCWLWFVFIVLITVFVFLSLPGLNRDLEDEEEVTSDVTSIRDKERKQDQQFKLKLREQARRVKHIQDICNDWKDAKQTVKQVIKYTINLIKPQTSIYRARAS